MRLPSFRTPRMLFLGSTLSMMMSFSAHAASVPISFSGWNTDVVAENTASDPGTGTTNNFGGTGLVWYQQGAPGSSNGLPTNGLFTSAYNSQVTFQFQPYSGPNAIVNSGSLVASSPAHYQNLEFLVASQGGAGQTFAVVLGFSDGSTTVLNNNSSPDPDWTFAGGNNALQNIGLSYRTNGWNDFAPYTVNLFEHDFSLSTADQAKTLNSLTFALTSGSNEALFAVSGTPTATPEPTSLALLGAGLFGFCVLRRNKL